MSNAAWTRSSPAPASRHFLATTTSHSRRQRSDPSTANSKMWRCRTDFRTDAVESLTSDAAELQDATRARGSAQASTFTLEHAAPCIDPYTAAYTQRSISRYAPELMKHRAATRYRRGWGSSQSSLQHRRNEVPAFDPGNASAPGRERLGQERTVQRPPYAQPLFADASASLMSCEGGDCDASACSAQDLESDSDASSECTAAESSDREDVSSVAQRHVHTDSQRDSARSVERSQYRDETVHEHACAQVPSVSSVGPDAARRCQTQAESQSVSSASARHPQAARLLPIKAPSIGTAGSARSESLDSLEPRLQSPSERHAQASEQSSRPRRTAPGQGNTLEAAMPASKAEHATTCATNEAGSAEEGNGRGSERSLRVTRIGEAPPGAVNDIAERTSDVPLQPPSSELDVLQACLCERGMTPLQAENISYALTNEESPFAHAPTLQARLDGLEAALPGIPLCELICKDLKTLTIDPAKAVPRLIFLDKRLGRPNLQYLVYVAPQLLYDEEVEGRVEHAITKLMALLPSGYEEQRLLALLAEAPTLIFRMDYYHDVRTFAELPADFRETLLSA